MNACSLIALVALLLPHFASAVEIVDCELNALKFLRGDAVNVLRDAADDEIVNFTIVLRQPTENSIDEFKMNTQNFLLNFGVTVKPYLGWGLLHLASTGTGAQIKKLLSDPQASRYLDRVYINPAKKSL